MSSFNPNVTEAISRENSEMKSKLIFLDEIILTDRRAGDCTEYEYI